MTTLLINDEIPAAMKPTAYVINLARGDVVDEAALIKHLQAGRIAGAGLDVSRSRRAKTTRYGRCQMSS